ncbi:MAG: (Fe-S)-binding protein [Candidatus Binataceae bacterium]
MTEVRLFATCLAEEFYPAVNEAVVRVLEGQRLKVRPMRSAFCCGQAPFNEGLREPALDLARRFLKSCEPGTPIIIPSGSCASMVKVFYGDLLANAPELKERVAAVRPWIFEFSQFLVNVLKVKYVGARYERRVAYHPACHLTRELKVGKEPLMLLGSVNGLRLVEFGHQEECCGFGGMFSVKFPQVSSAIVDDKVERLVECGAEAVVANDCGCLMQIGGALHRKRIPIETRHLAEVLASR